MALSVFEHKYCSVWIDFQSPFVCGCLGLRKAFIKICVVLWHHRSRSELNYPASHITVSTQHHNTLHFLYRNKKKMGKAKYQKTRTPKMGGIGRRWWPWCPLSPQGALQQLQHPHFPLHLCALYVHPSTNVTCHTTNDTLVVLLFIFFLLVFPATLSPSSFPSWIKKSKNDCCSVFISCNRY